jgi:hypothetical protein
MIIKFRLLVVAVFTVVCSIFVDSPFHGYYLPFGLIYLLTFSGLLFFLIPTDKFIWAEKIVYTILMSVIALLTATFITHVILGSLYGYDSDFYDELKSPHLLENLVFYSSTYLVGIGLFSIWLKYKKPVYD